MKRQKAQNSWTCFCTRLVCAYLSLTLLMNDSAFLYASAAPVSLQNSIDLTVPADLGRLEEFHPAQNSSAPIIYYIQDAHDSLDAQQNIARLIDYFVSEHKVPMVLEEGYEGPVPTGDYFSSMESREERERAAFLLMDKLRLSGAEYAHINRQSDFELIGVDSISQHRENIEWYRKTVEIREAVAGDLKTLEFEINQLAQHFLPSPVKEWLKLKERKNREQMTVWDYVQRLASLYGTLPEAEFPVLHSLLYAQTPVTDVDGKRFFKEIGEMEKQYADRFLTDEKSREILDLLQDQDLVERLMALQISSTEYDLIRQSFESFSTENWAQQLSRLSGKSLALSKRWEAGVRSAIQFYETAKDRDVTLEKNLKWFAGQNLKSAVLVFGGFHKEAIREILRQHGFSFAVITPKITKMEERHQRDYVRLMSRGYYDFEAPLWAARAAPPERIFEFVSAAQFPQYLHALSADFFPEMNLARSESRLEAGEAIVETVFDVQRRFWATALQKGSELLLVRMNSTTWLAGGSYYGGAIDAKRPMYDIFLNQDPQGYLGSLVLELDEDGRVLGGDVDIKARRDPDGVRRAFLNRWIELLKGEALDTRHSFLSQFRMRSRPGEDDAPPQGAIPIYRPFDPGGLRSESRIELPAQEEVFADLDARKFTEVAEKLSGVILAIRKANDESEQGAHHADLMKLLSYGLHYLEERRPSKDHLQFIYGYYHRLRKDHPELRVTAATIMIESIVSRIRYGREGTLQELKALQYLHRRMENQFLSRRQQKDLAWALYDMQSSGKNSDPRIAKIFDEAKKIIFLTNGVLDLPSVQRDIFEGASHSQLEMLEEHLHSDLPGSDFIVKENGEVLVYRYDEEAAASQPYFAVIVNLTGIPMRVVIKDKTVKLWPDHVKHVTGNRLLEAIQAPWVWVKEGARFNYIREIQGVEITDIMIRIREFPEDLRPRLFFALGVAASEAYILAMSDRPRNMVAKVERLREYTEEDLAVSINRAVINIDRENAVSPSSLEMDPEEDIGQTASIIIRWANFLLPSDAEIFREHLASYLKGFRSGYLATQFLYKENSSLVAEKVKEALAEENNPRAPAILERLKLSEAQLDRMSARIQEKILEALPQRSESRSNDIPEFIKPPRDFRPHNGEVLSYQGKGVLLFGSNAQGKSLLSAILAGSRESGYMEADASSGWSVVSANWSLVQFREDQKPAQLLGWHDITVQRPARVVGSRFLGRTNIKETTGSVPIRYVIGLGDRSLLAIPQAWRAQFDEMGIQELTIPTANLTPESEKQNVPQNREEHLRRYEAIAEQIRTFVAEDVGEPAFRSESRTVNSWQPLGRVLNVHHPHYSRSGETFRVVTTADFPLSDEKLKTLFPDSTPTQLTFVYTSQADDLIQRAVMRSQWISGIIAHYISEDDMRRARNRGIRIIDLSTAGDQELEIQSGDVLHFHWKDLELWRHPVSSVRSESRDRSGDGFTGGPLSNEGISYRHWLNQQPAWEGFTAEQRNSVINALVRIQDKALRKRGMFFDESQGDGQAVLAYQPFDIKNFSKRVLGEAEKYRQAVDSKGKPLFRESQIKDLLFKKLIPLEWVEFFMKEEGMRKSHALMLVRAWTDPKAKWVEVKEVRDELVKEEGLGKGEATKIVLSWKDPKAKWKDVKEVRDQLITEEGMGRSDATTMVLRWTDPKAKWEDLKAVRHQLITEEGLGKHDATRIVLGWSEPKAKWKEAKEVRDELINEEGLGKHDATTLALTWAKPKTKWKEAKEVRAEIMDEEGLGKSDATLLVLGWTDPKAKWAEMKKVRDELMDEEKLAKRDATRIVLRWTDPHAKWIELKEVRDELMREEGLAKSDATKLVLAWAEPKAKWKELKEVRDELMREENLGKTDATKIVLTWIDPKAKWEAIKKVRSAFDPQMKQRTLRYLLETSTENIAVRLREEFRKTDVEIQTMLEPLIQYDETHRPGRNPVIPALRGEHDVRRSGLDPNDRDTPLGPDALRSESRADADASALQNRFGTGRSESRFEAEENFRTWIEENGLLEWDAGQHYAVTEAGTFQAEMVWDEDEFTGQVVIRPRDLQRFPDRDLIQGGYEDVFHLPRGILGLMEFRFGMHEGRPVLKINGIQPGDGYRRIKDKYRNRLDVWRKLTLSRIAEWAEQNQVALYAMGPDSIRTWYGNQLSDFEIQMNYVKPFEDGDWNLVNGLELEGEIYHLQSSGKFAGQPISQWYVYRGNAAMPEKQNARERDQKTLFEQVVEMPAWRMIVPIDIKSNFDRMHILLYNEPEFFEAFAAEMGHRSFVSYLETLGTSVSAFAEAIWQLERYLMEHRPSYRTRMSRFYRYSDQYVWFYKAIRSQLRTKKKTQDRSPLRIDYVGPSFFEEPLTLLALIRTAYEKEGIRLEDMDLEFHIYDGEPLAIDLFKQGRLVFLNDALLYDRQIAVANLKLEWDISETEASMNGDLEAIDQNLRSFFQPVTELDTPVLVLSPKLDDGWVQKLKLHPETYSPAVENSRDRDYVFVNNVFGHVRDSIRLDIAEAIIRRAKPGAPVLAMGVRIRSQYRFWNPLGLRAEKPGIESWLFANLSTGSESRPPLMLPADANEEDPVVLLDHLIADFEQIIEDSIYTDRRRMAQARRGVAFLDTAFGRVLEGDPVRALEAVETVIMELSPFPGWQEKVHSLQHVKEVLAESSGFDAHRSESRTGSDEPVLQDGSETGRFETSRTDADASAQQNQFGTGRSESREEPEVIKSERVSSIDEFDQRVKSWQRSTVKIIDKAVLFDMQPPEDQSGGKMVTIDLPRTFSAAEIIRSRPSGWFGSAGMRRPAEWLAEGDDHELEIELKRRLVKTADREAYEYTLTVTYVLSDPDEGTFSRSESRVEGFSEREAVARLIESFKKVRPGETFVSAITFTPAGRVLIGLEPVKQEEGGDLEAKRARFHDRLRGTRFEGKTGDYFDWVRILWLASEDQRDKMPWLTILPGFRMPINQDDLVEGRYPPGEAIRNLREMPANLSEVELNDYRRHDIIRAAQLLRNVLSGMGLLQPSDTPNASAVLVPDLDLFTPAGLRRTKYSLKRGDQRMDLNRLAALETGKLRRRLPQSIEEAGFEIPFTLIREAYQRAKMVENSGRFDPSIGVFHSQLRLPRRLSREEVISIAQKYNKLFPDTPILFSDAAVALLLPPDHPRLQPRVREPVKEEIPDSQQKAEEVPAVAETPVEETAVSAEEVPVEPETVTTSENAETEAVAVPESQTAEEPAGESVEVLAEESKGAQTEEAIAPEELVQEPALEPEPETPVITAERPKEWKAPEALPEEIRQTLKPVNWSSKGNREIKVAAIRAAVKALQRHNNRLNIPLRVVAEVLGMPVPKLNSYFTRTLQEDPMDYHIIPEAAKTVEVFEKILLAVTADMRGNDKPFEILHVDEVTTYMGRARGTLNPTMQRLYPGQNPSVILAEKFGLFLKYETEETQPAREHWARQHLESQKIDISESALRQAMKIKEHGEDLRKSMPEAAVVMEFYQTYLEAHENQAPTLREYAQQFSLSRPTMRKVLDEMEKAGHKAETRRSQSDRSESRSFPEDQVWLEIFAEAVEKLDPSRKDDYQILHALRESIGELEVDDFHSLKPVNHIAWELQVLSWNTHYEMSEAFFKFSGRRGVLHRNVGFANVIINQVHDVFLKRTFEELFRRDRRGFFYNEDWIRKIMEVSEGWVDINPRSTLSLTDKYRVFMHERLRNALLGIVERKREETVMESFLLLAENGYTLEIIEALKNLDEPESVREHYIPSLALRDIEQMAGRLPGQEIPLGFGFFQRSESRADSNESALQSGSETGRRFESRQVTQTPAVSETKVSDHSETSIENLNTPVGIFLDVRELLQLKPEAVDARMNELLALLSRHPSFDLYIDEPDGISVLNIPLPKFQKLIQEYRSQVHIGRLDRAGLSKKKILLQISFIQKESTAAETQTLIQNLQTRFAIQETILPLEYTQAGALKAFLDLAESLTPAQLLQEVSEAYAVRGADGRWRLAEDYLHSIWTEMMGAYVIQWSA